MTVCAAAIGIFLLRSSSPNSTASAPDEKGGSAHFATCGKKDSLGNKLAQVEGSDMAAPVSHGKSDTLGSAMASSIKRTNSSASFTESVDNTANNKFFGDN